MSQTVLGLAHILFVTLLACDTVNQVVTMAVDIPHCIMRFFVAGRLDLTRGVNALAITTTGLLTDDTFLFLFRCCVCIG